jgi:hypothetical protein
MGQRVQQKTSAPDGKDFFGRPIFLDIYRTGRNSRLLFTNTLNQCIQMLVHRGFDQFRQMGIQPLVQQLCDMLINDGFDML